MVISLRGSVPQFDPKTMLAFHGMDVEIKSDGYSTSYVLIRSHKHIRSLIFLKNDRAGTSKGLEPHHTTI